MLHITHSVLIKCDLTYAADFLSNTENLVLWTNFFKKILARRKNVCQFFTPMGKSITTIDKNYSYIMHAIQINIVSKFSRTKRIERAVILLKEEYKNICAVSFTITTPSAMPEEIRTKLSLNMQNELANLKTILEGE